MFKYGVIFNNCVKQCCMMFMFRLFNILYKIKNTCRCRVSKSNGNMLLLLPNEVY